MRVAKSNDESGLHFFLKGINENLTTQAVLKRVAQKYDRDFKLFGYSPKYLKETENEGGKKQ
jgi:hypothetical protein